jgi:hypothetical protein
MSTQKVTDLTALASADDDDVLLISDVSASTSKKITVANLVNSKVTTAVSNLVDSAPEALDTLNELAAALGDDADFATTVTTSIGTKWTQDNTKISNWDTAYGWGDHASAGYLTSFTETNDLTAAVTWTNIPDANVPQSAVTQHQAALSITEGQISDLGGDIVLDSDIGVTVQAYNANLVTYATNGNTAYGWGDHASEGYLTSTDITNMLETTDIGVTVQGYDADTAKTDTTQNFTAPQRSADTVDNDGSFDLSAAQNFTCTPTGSITLTFTNIPDGQSGFILLVNTTPQTVSLHANTKGDANLATTLSTAGTYLVSYYANGTNVYLTTSGAIA